jgi:VWFA-related protein
MRSALPCGKSILPILVVAVAPAFQGDVVFRSDSTLALTHFHVLKNDLYVTDLKVEDVVLLEDGVPRKFTVFENSSYKRTLPVEIALLFDFSGSVVQNGLYDPVALKEGLFDELDNVRIAIYGFDNKLFRYCDPTSDIDSLSKAFLSLQIVNGPRQEIAYVLPGNKHLTPHGTSIYASVLQTSREMSRTRDNSTWLMLTFSDGLDTTRMHAKDIAEVIRERQITVYPVALGHRRVPPNDEFHVLEYARLGELTGGRSYDVEFMDRTVMKQILEGLVWSVRTEYIVGFSPECSNTPGRPELEVRLRDRSLGQVVGGKRTLMW